MFIRKFNCSVYVNDIFIMGEKKYKVNYVESGVRGGDKIWLTDEKGKVKKIDNFDTSRLDSFDNKSNTWMCKE